VPVDVSLRGAVEAWIADDPDGRDQAELRGLLNEATRSGETTDAAAAELRDRFAGRLTFGTAGLRGVVAAGPNRMNRAVVRAATAAVAGWLHGPRGSGGTVPPGGNAGATGVGVVVGCDARHRSAEFAEEVARVLAGAGLAVHVLPLPCPTPLLAFAVRHLGTAAGIMVTASHNPAADNGYKLYLHDGAQVIPPADREIEARIGALGALSSIPLAPAASPLITRHGDEVAAAYLDGIIGAVGAGGAVSAGGAVGATPLRVVYTPMHGVAGSLMLRAIAQAGYPEPRVVAAQAEPDPDFPTVAFPNPEEPGALDLALADARSQGADLVLANDPDGDRLAVAIPDPAAAGGWRALTGDQLGALLGAAQLGWTADQGGSRLAATTIVSSTLLSAIAADAGVSFGETLTGFKWIARAADAVPGARFVFGYEEALGYAVGDVVRDKDGMSAALAMLRLASEASAAGQSVLARYDALESAHGVHLTSQVTLRTADTSGVMRRLRAGLPKDIGGQPVESAADLADGGGTGLPPSDVLIFRLDGARVVLRPSGTEPKIKCYIEIVEQPAGRSLGQARAAAASRLAPLRSGVEALLAG
jgi:phosphomannomutase